MIAAISAAVRIRTMSRRGVEVMRGGGREERRSGDSTMASPSTRALGGRSSRPRVADLKSMVLVGDGRFGGVARRRAELISRR